MHTRASILAKNYVTDSKINESFTSNKDLFKMKKFKMVGPRTNTNRGARPKKMDLNKSNLL